MIHKNKLWLLAILVRKSNEPKLKKKHIIPYLCISGSRSEPIHLILGILDKLYHLSQLIFLGKKKKIPKSKVLKAPLKCPKPQRPPKQINALKMQSRRHLAKQRIRFGHYALPINKINLDNTYIFALLMQSHGLLQSASPFSIQPP